MTICSRCLHYGWHDPLEATLFSPDGEGYCILHAPHEMKKDLQSEVNEAFLDRLCIRHECDTDNDTIELCNISGAVINISVRIENKKIIKAVVSDVLFLDNIIFEDCLFSDGLAVLNSNFKSSLLIVKSKFEKELCVSKCAISELFSIRDSKISSQALFAGSDINKSSFVNNVWESDVVINECSFNSHILFDNSIFDKDAYFINTTFGVDGYSYVSFDGITTKYQRSIDFNGSKIMCTFSMKGAKLNGYTRFDNLHFQHQVFFNESILGEASFKNCTFGVKPLFDRTNLERTSLLGAQVELLNLMACIWPTSKGRCVTFDSRKVDRKGYFEITSDGALPPHAIVPPIRQLEDLYRRLKKTAQDEEDDQRASDFHYAEKELQRLLALQIAKKPESARDHHISACNVHGRIHYAFEAAILWIYKLVSEYGEGPGRALLILLILALLPLMFIGIGDTVPSLNFEAFRLAAPGILNKWVYFSPMVKIPGPSEAGAGLRILLVFYHIAITLQAALFGFALRNRFKR